MDPGDLEPPEWLQVPTGSKRPSPSPSEGEEDREIKKFRTQPSNVDEDWEFQSNELNFPFTNFPLQDSFGNQTETFLSNQDAYGVPFSTTTGFDMGFEVSAAPFMGGDVDYSTKFGNESLNTAVYGDPVSEDNTYWGDSFLQNPDQASASFIYGSPSTGGDYAEQFGGGTIADEAFQDQFPDAFMSECEVPAAITDLTPEFGALSRVESIPIRRAQVDEPFSKSPATTVPKQSMDVHINCDTCFGVVSNNDSPLLHDLSDSSKGDSNSCVIVHSRIWEPFHSR